MILYLVKKEGTQVSLKDFNHPHAVVHVCLMHRAQFLDILLYSVAGAEGSALVS